MDADEPLLFPISSAWSIPLDEPARQVPPGVDSEPIPELLRFPTDQDAFPTEGHHPRLFRFGRVA